MGNDLVDKAILEFEKKEGKGGNISGEYSIRVVRKDGEEIYNSGMVPCNCFVIAFLKQLHRYLYANDIYAGCPSCPGAVDLTWTDGTTSSNAMWPPGAGGTCPDVVVCGEDVTNIGIVVGSGTTVVTLEDHALESQHLSDALYHSACECITENGWALDGNVMYTEFTRSFVNTSEATLSLGEMGLYSLLTRGYVDCPPVTPITKSAMLMRDVFGPTSVPAGGTVYGLYRIILNAGD